MSDYDQNRLRLRPIRAPFCRSVVPNRFLRGSEGRRSVLEQVLCLLRDRLFSDQR